MAPIPNLSCHDPTAKLAMILPDLLQFVQYRSGSQPSNFSYDVTG